MKFTNKKFINPDGRIEWAVTCEFGSLSFWATPVRAESIAVYGDTHYGGVETHYNEKSKPDYLGDGSYHDDCMSNGGKCWHDGTSLWAIEYWIPNVMPMGDDAIWKGLQYYAFKELREGNNNEPKT